MISVSILEIVIFIEPSIMVERLEYKFAFQEQIISNYLEVALKFSM